VHVGKLPSPTDLSVLILTAISGESVATCRVENHARRAVREAGRDLARLNGVTVDGFGFVSRATLGWPLAGEFPRYEDFVTSFLPDPWPGPMSELFLNRQIDDIDGLIAEHRAMPLRAGTLAHGDFDTTPIFHSEGRYSGLIDFGEVRGADPLFDLGHFLLHDREHLAWMLFDELLKGYQEVSDTSSDFERAVRSSAVLLGLRQLGRWIAPERGWWTEHRLVRARIQRIQELLGEQRDL